MKMIVWFLLNTVGMMIGGMAMAAQSKDQVVYPVSNHSFARPEVMVTHLDLDLTVDFESKTIAGKATLHLKNLQAARQVVLDTRDLTIQKVTRDGSSAPANFVLDDEVPFLGRPLVIDILPSTKTVTVSYSTAPQAAALQWLSPAQTLGKKQPFLLTQSEAILLRTWIPCQDTPSVRVTYNATVHVPVGLMAIMSAENKPEMSPNGVYTFKMQQSIPSYLIALAVGDITFAPIGSRAGVFAEPALIEKAKWEFADLEKMIQIAENLYGPYRFGRFDVLVLPPSFPFGGMENPRLTFVSPTILAGDRSLVSVVAHELAHSWSGNLVTNSAWEEFCLNEGFAVYVETRIIEKLYGKERAEMHALLGLQKLEEAIANKELKPADKQLKLSLMGRDPDEAINEIAYEKGYFFLRTLEEATGRKKWDKFLRKYFDDHAFQSITTEQFLTFLASALIKGDSKLKEKLKIDAWVFGPTLPSNVAKVISNSFARVDQELGRWQKGTKAEDLATKGWATDQWLRFLGNLPTPLAPEKMAELDLTFHFSENGNAEIIAVWLTQAIKNSYQPAYPRLETFLISVGRRKLIKPLYEEMALTSEGMKMARGIYAKARTSYHSIAVGTIDGILKTDK